MCEGHDECKSEREIRDWLKRKYILLIYNQIRFDTESFFEDAKVKESKLLYVPMNSQIRQIVPLKVQKMSLEL